MMRRRLAAMVVVSILATACATSRASGPLVDSPDAVVPGDRPDTPAAMRAAPATVPTTAAPPAPPAPSSTIDPLPDNIFDPACARRVQPGESLSRIADGVDDPTVTAASLQAENGITDPDRVNAGAILDMCPGNGIDDLTGDERVPEDQEVDPGATSGVAAQQRRLNELFADTGLPELAVDGVSGQFTRQQLCAARLVLDIPVTRADMEPGSMEEIALMTTAGIRPPATAATSEDRWILIDKTCQILVAGEGDQLRFVFKTSTGEPGWETHNDDRMGVFRYNPALDNGGWHNSTKFPVAEDNPLNGNMYKPLYFHGGQAIHGANNVPPSPASKGCARLRPEHQDLLVAWLGLDDVTQQIYEPGRIGATVTVQGDFVTD
ncbi:MAG: L,D-transpeptidase family protein [Desertimonas sp.]